MSLLSVPVTFRQACAFIETRHRDHRPPRGMKFALGVADGALLVGVATVGRPVARHLDDGCTVEVTRTCTSGSRNANSMLYDAAWRAARALGYRRLITYTQRDERGRACAPPGCRLCARCAPAQAGTRRPVPARLIASTSSRTRWEIHTAEAYAAASCAAVA